MKIIRNKYICRFFADIKTKNVGLLTRTIFFLWGNDNMNVRNFVKERRAALGWKQEYLSRHSCVGRSTISNIETGRYIPGVDIALLLAGALSCTVEDLFELEERRTL